MFGYWTLKKLYERLAKSSKPRSTDTFLLEMPDAGDAMRWIYKEIGNQHDEKGPRWTAFNTDEYDMTIKFYRANDAMKFKLGYYSS